MNVYFPRRKKHKICKDIVHRIQEIINEDPGMSMRCIAREMSESDAKFARSLLKILDISHLFLLPSKYQRIS